MRDHSVPCLHSGPAEAAHHRTYNDDALCDRCRCSTRKDCGTCRTLREEAA